MPYVSPIFSKPLKIPVGMLNISPFSRITSPASPLIPQKNPALSEKKLKNHETYRKTKNIEILMNLKQVARVPKLTQTRNVYLHVYLCIYTCMYVYVYFL